MISSTGSLQSCRELFGMSGDNSVVGICRKNKNRRVDHTFFDIMQWRVGKDEFKLLRAAFSIAILRYPVASDREAVVAQHICQGNRTDNSTIQVRTLEHASSYQQPTITSSTDG